MQQIWQEIKNTWQNILTVIKTNWKKIVLLIVASLSLTISNFNLRNFTNNVITYVKNNIGKTIIFTIILTILSFIIVILFRFGTIITFVSIFSVISSNIGDWIFPAITGRLMIDAGVNIWMARGIAVLLSAGIILGVYLCLSWGRNSNKKRIIGLSLLIIGFSTYFITIFFITKDNNFNPDGTANKCFAETPNGIEEISCNYSKHPVYGTTVKPLSEAVIAMSVITKNNNFNPDGTVSKCFATTPNGIEEVSCSLRVHPIYGTPVQPLSTEIVAIQQADKSKLFRVKPGKNTRFFDSYGNPLVWYYPLPDGKIEFFNQPGLHPQFKGILSPVTGEIVQKFFEYLDEEKKNKIIMDAKIWKDAPDSGLKDLYNLLQEPQGGDTNGTRN